MFGNILITGGTGSFGKKFLEHLIKIKYKKKIVIFSRDELKQFYLKSKYPYIKNLRFFLGDIRDLPRLKYAFNDIDTIVHAAALKQVDTAEYNPFEFIKTNILGSENIINAALETNVKKVVALSTDKASSPANLYGASKLCSDKLFSAANIYKGKKNINFSVVRYGNVFGSRGSIIHKLLDEKKNKKLNLTHPKMTRFNISLEEAVFLVLYALKNAKGGEIFVPKLKSYNLVDLGNAVCSKSKFNFIGIRPGEKIHEEMISNDDAINTFIGKKYYIITNPAIPSVTKYYKEKLAKVEKEFSLSSENVIKLTIPELKKIISEFKIDYN
jgi:FlaA1/EpsC-like NDP-sugar epimerase